MISEKETKLAEFCIQTAIDCGADKCRVTLSKSEEEIVATLDGEIDRVTGCTDRSISIVLFAKGRYGTFSTNKLEQDALKRFISKAVETVLMMEVDECHDLPSPDRCCKIAVKGTEMDIFDPARAEVTAMDRSKAALDASLTLKGGVEGLISEEGEYSDMEYDTLILDTQGLCCRHTETTFDYGVEVTVEDSDGNKYNEYWWTSCPRRKDFDPSECGKIAFDKAKAQFGSGPVRKGTFNMVVSSEVASRLVSPLLGALKGHNIQQNNSFLADSMGRKVFSEGLTITDEPIINGQTGSKLFDSEGVLATPAPIIENGVVKRFFLSTYTARKLQMEPTIEEAIRPVLHGWPRKGLDASSLMKICDSGIYVTDFNGGNSNSATGDFSYGVKGFLFENGEIVRPVSEMLITGNFLDLWNNFLGAGEDARTCMSKLIPTLAFSNVNFNS